MSTYEKRWHIFWYLIGLGLLAGAQVINESFARESPSCAGQFISLFRWTFFTHNIAFHLSIATYWLQFWIKDEFFSPIFQDFGFALQIIMNYFFSMVMFAPILILLRYIFSLRDCDDWHLLISMKVFYWMSTGLLAFPVLIVLVYSVFNRGGIFGEMARDIKRALKRVSVERKHNRLVRQSLFDRDRYAEYCMIIHPVRLFRFSNYDAYYMRKYCERGLSKDFLEYLSHHILLCKVCLGTFEETDRVMVTRGCRHIFHADCVMAHIMSRVTCPECTKNIREDFKKQVVEDHESQQPLTLERIDCLGHILPSSANAVRFVAHHVPNRPQVDRIEQFYYVLQ